MPPVIEKLLKFLRLEADRGYDNRSVLGGLDRMLGPWEAEARQQNVPEAVIKVVLSRLRDYPQLSPASRQEALRGVHARLRNAYPELTADGRGATHPEAAAEVPASQRPVSEIASRPAEAQPSVPTLEDREAPGVEEPHQPEPALSQPPSEPEPASAASPIMVEASTPETGGEAAESETWKDEESGEDAAWLDSDLEETAGDEGAALPSMPPAPASRPQRHPPRPARLRWARRSPPSLALGPSQPRRSAGLGSRRSATCSGTCRGATMTTPNSRPSTACGTARK